MPEFPVNILALGEHASDPLATANKGKAYSKDVGGVTQLFYKDSAGVVYQLTPVLPTTLSALSTHLYVSPALGNDANDGTTPATAFKTTTRLMQRLAGIWSGPIFCHYGPGTVDITQFAGGIPVIPANDRIGVFVWGDGNGGTEGDGFTLVDSGVVAAGSTSKIFNTALGATDRTGLTLEMTSGALINQRRILWSTTAATAEVGQAFGAAPAIGVTFKIVRPTTIFEAPASANPAPNYTSLDLGLANSSVASTTEGVSRPINFVCWINVELRKNAALLEFDCQMQGAHQFYGVITDSVNMLIPGLVVAGTSVALGGFPGWHSNVPNNFFALSQILGSPIDGTIPNWEGWGLGSVPGALTTVLNNQGGYLQLKGSCTDRIVAGVASSQTYMVSGVRTKTFVSIGFGSNFYSSASRHESPNATPAINCNHGSDVRVGSGGVISAPAGTGVVCTTGGIVALEATVNVTGGVLSLDASGGGQITMDAATAAALVGNVKISPANVLNMVTGAAVAGTQAPAAFAAAGQGFSNGVSGVLRVS